MKGKSLLRMVFLLVAFACLIYAVSAASEDTHSDNATTNTTPVVKTQAVNNSVNQTPTAPQRSNIARPTASATATTTPSATDAAEINARGNIPIVGPSGRIVHYTLYANDGYINRAAGLVGTNDTTAIGSWPNPIYIWGFSDIDPNVAGNAFTVPPGAYPPVVGGPVGNAKFPAPVIEANVGDDVYITLHNRGFYQTKQGVQDDHSLHLHGIHAQAQYDGFPETAGGYTEQLRYFWEEPWYLALSPSAASRDDDAAWNALTSAQQLNFLRTNTPLIRANKLSPAGGVVSQFNTGTAPPSGTLGLTAPEVENLTQFTYYFRASFAGSLMYHCHVAAAEHIQQGMYGALVLRPADHSQTVYGAGTGTDYDKEYFAFQTEIDPLWHYNLEQGVDAPVGFDPSTWRPQLWFVNGRTFPSTVFPFAYNTPLASDPYGCGAPEPYPKYNTYITATQGQKFLLRYINMGYQPHTYHQHGWHFKVVGTDGFRFPIPYEKMTMPTQSGETYDAITLVDPVYGVNYPAGAPLAVVSSPRGQTQWRQIYPIHDHYDYQVTTAGIYPGGAVMLIEATGVPGAGNPTFENPHSLAHGGVVLPPAVEPFPPAPAT
ncbi:MAG: multicopper oxidase domain-containing protein [Methanoregulaceae archaeon]|nr:multicopper oxidase domain-containing protein [Methanoregulaceae archaeon]